MTAASTSRLDALSTSADRLRRVVEPLGPDAIGGRAYPSEWSVAQVMSHLGSGAVIFRRTLEAHLAQAPVADDLAPRVWAEWDAKAPRAQVDEGLAADGALVHALVSTDAAARAAFSFAMGPTSVDFDGFVGLRLNEHALHTWDIEVALDPQATVPAEVAAVVVDNLEMIGRFTARPTPGDPRTVTVRTAAPDRRYRIALTPEGAELGPAGDEDDDEGGQDDLAMPAEALVRLVYGRLDPAHTPTVTGDPALLDRLRATYPGP